MKRLLDYLLRRSYAHGGVISPHIRTDEPAGIIHPAMHFDSREDMERHLMGEG